MRTSRPSKSPRRVRFSNRSLAAALALAGLATLAACKTPPAEAPPAPQSTRVENPALGVVIASMPSGWKVEANEGATLKLTREGPSGSGVASIAIDGSKRSINVIEEAKAAQKEIEALPEATFSGGNELVTPVGAGYAVRGSWTENGARIEERRIFALHPDGSGRLLTLTDRYPAGDAENARARFGAELELLSAIEGVTPGGG